MGSIKMRNPLLSKKFKRTETRLLIIDDNQIRYNQICELLTENEHHIRTHLLDDLNNFEKQLHQTWDLIIFGQAYDLKFEQALTLIRASKQPHVPMLLLKPEDYDTQSYPSYIRKGIYDIINLDFPERCYYGLMRALSFSRALQSQKQLMQELETFQNHAQNLAEDSHKPIAFIQEGIHLQANQEYLDLFGFEREEDLVGLPVLDLLQPVDLTNFKFRFKKISKGQFDVGQFKIESHNPLIENYNPLPLEFMPAPQDEDMVQLTIDIELATPSNEDQAIATPVLDLPEIVVPSPVAAEPAKVNVHQLINRTLTNQPSDINALVLFSLAACPEKIFQSDWQTAKSYFSSMREFLKEQTNVPLFKVDTGLLIGLFQAESKEKLESKLIGLNSLTKPQLLGVESSTYPLHLKIGYLLIEEEIQSESDLEKYISIAFRTPLPMAQKEDVELNLVSLKTDLLSQPQEELTVLQGLRHSLERGEIHLKYQQLYDKEDENLYTYEVTSGFIFNNTWQDLDNLAELSEDPELSIQLDRWIVVEACKQLHNFTTQYPTAKLIINLNKQVLFEDPTFPELVAKLISILRSKQDFPLILQFAEQDISLHFAEAQKRLELLAQHGAQISLRHFGSTMYSESLLKQLDISCLTLSDDLSSLLQDSEKIDELQEKVHTFNEIKPVQILVRNLNDMSMFANAWSVDIRFIQGDYFQKKLDHLIDVQDQ